MEACCNASWIPRSILQPRAVCPAKLWIKWSPQSMDFKRLTDPRSTSFWTLASSWRIEKLWKRPAESMHLHDAFKEFEREARNLRVLADAVNYLAFLSRICPPSRIATLRWRRLRTISATSRAGRLDRGDLKWWVTAFGKLPELHGLGPGVIQLWPLSTLDNCLQMGLYIP